MEPQAIKTWIPPPTTLPKEQQWATFSFLLQSLDKVDKSQFFFIAGELKTGNFNLLRKSHIQTNG